MVIQSTPAAVSRNKYILKNKPVRTKKRTVFVVYKYRFRRNVLSMILLYFLVAGLYGGFVAFFNVVFGR